MDTDNSEVKAWGGMGVGWRGAKKGKYETSVTLNKNNFFEKVKTIKKEILLLYTICHCLSLCLFTHSFWITCTHMCTHV